MIFFQEPCPFCGSINEPIFVHGHYQCQNCGQNVMPCCEGNDASDQEDSSNQQEKPGN